MGWEVRRRFKREGDIHNPLQYSCLENSMDSRVWQATVHGVTESLTQLSDLKRVSFPHWVFFSAAVLCSVAQLCVTLCNSWTVAHQTLLSMDFSLKEYWSGLPFPSPGDLPHPGIKPGFPALQAESLSLNHLGSPMDLFGIYVWF